MPSLRSFAPEIHMAKDESVVVQVDAECIYEQVDKTYYIPCLLNGKPAKLSGGKRIMNAVFHATAGHVGLVTLKITAHGEPRTFERDYEVKAV